MKQILLTLLLGLLFLPMQADTVNEDFEDISVTDAQGQPVANAWTAGTGLSNGWKVVGGTIYASGDYGDYGLWSTAHTGKKSLVANYGSKNKAYIVVPGKLMGELKLWARKASTSSRSQGTINIYEVEEADGSYAVVSTLATFSLTSTWKEYTADLGQEGKLVAINMVRSTIDDVEYTPYEVPMEPIMEVRLNGEKANGYEHDFGLLSQDSSVTFSLANVGAGILHAKLAAPDGFVVSPDTLSVGAGLSEPFTVTMLTATPGYRQGAVSLKAERPDSTAIGVKGLVRDADKVYLDFNTLPQGWTLNEYGQTEDSVLKAATWNDAVLTSPVLESGEGEVLFFRCSAASESSYQMPIAKVAYSEDGETWNEIDDNLAENAIYNRWQNIYVQNIPATATRVRLTLRYVMIDDLYGLTLPKRAIMKVNAGDYDFGMTDRDTTCRFTISNEGTLPLVGLTASSADSAFAVSVPDTIQPGQTAPMELTLRTGKMGMHQTVITVKAEGQEDVSFLAKGYVADTTAVWLTFRGDSLPEGWSSKGWTFDQGIAYASYGGQHDVSILSPELYIAEADSLVMRVKGEYSSSWISLMWSADNGETWKAVKELSTELSDTLHTISIYPLPQGTGRLRIDGSYAYIAGLNGTHFAVPQMEIRHRGRVIENGYADDFGPIFAPTTHEYTIRNTGTATLRGHVSMSSEGVFELSEDSFALAPDSMATVTLSPVLDTDFGLKTADITFEPADTALLPLTITVTAETRDSTLWHEEFEKGLPGTWTNSGWTTETPEYGNGTQMATIGEVADNALITPRLRAKAGETLVFDAVAGSADASLQVEYSTNEKGTWTAYAMTMAAQPQARQRLIFTVPADGLYFLRFTGANCALDNFYGLAYEPNAPVPDGISSHLTETDKDSRMFDLSGRRINPTNARPGIYIRGGKKLVRR